jgi:hypothetical protein
MLGLLPAKVNVVVVAPNAPNYGMTSSLKGFP